MIIADLHIHSKYARWCSKKLTVENIWKMAIVKGIDIIWTGDFTHPDRFEQLKYYLEVDDTGFLVPKAKFLKKWSDDLKSSKEEFSFYVNNEILSKLEQGYYPKFVIQTEINNVFVRQSWKKEKKYRIHNCILVEDFQIAETILDYLSQFWKVESDGRLTVKKDQEEILYYLKNEFPNIIFFPAHIWTPYFWVLWSKFGFSSLKEAFWKSYFLVDAVETGLSSDPIMNWINEEIDPFVIISNSDAHSLENMAREWNIIKSKVEWKYNFTYKDLEKILKERKYRFFREFLPKFERDYLDSLFSQETNFYLESTIEFYPQEWKYFGDGHSKCDFSCSPAETIERNWICPICWKPLTIWVFHRTYILGDNEREKNINFWSKYFWSNEEIKKISSIFGRPWYKYIVPLWDLIYEVWWFRKWTKAAQRKYNELILKFWSEFYILLNLPLSIAFDYDEKFWLALEKVRKGDIYIKSWYDWVYGVVQIWNKIENKSIDVKLVKNRNSDNNYKQLGLF